MGMKSLAVAFSVSTGGAGLVGRRALEPGRICTGHAVRRAARTRVQFEGAPPPGSGGGGFGYSWEDAGGGDEEGDSGAFDFFAWFTKCQRKFPVTTNAVVSAVLMAFSDVVAQYTAWCGKHRGELSLQGLKRFLKTAYDLRRTAAVGTFAAAILGPFLHVWYGILARLYPGSTTPQSLLFKIATDQLVASFLVNFGFISVTGLLEGNDLAQVTRTLKRNYWDSMFLNWKIWPTAQAINFGLISPTYQVVFANTVGFFFTVALSYLAHRDS